MNIENLIIRDETEADVPAIARVTISAFNALEISSHTEQYIIETLRAGHALTLSLVAEVDGQVVGHIAFSPVTLSDGTRGWFGLGPLSVQPGCQRMGVGSALIREGISRMKGMGAKGCCLVGHPSYYRRFGFENIPGLYVTGVQPEVFFALSFDGTYPQGRVDFNEAFLATHSPAVAEDADTQSL